MATNLLSVSRHTNWHIIIGIIYHPKCKPMLNSGNGTCGIGYLNLKFFFFLPMTTQFEKMKHKPSTMGKVGSLCLQSKSKSCACNHVVTAEFKDGSVITFQISGQDLARHYWKQLPEKVQLHIIQWKPHSYRCTIL